MYLRPEDVLHIPGLGFDGLVGYSPIAMAKNAVGLAIATEEYGARFFANGAAPGGVLEHPGVVKTFEVWITPVGDLLDQWEIHRQFLGLAKPKREWFIDDVIPHKV